MARFAAQLADALEERARAEGISGPVGLQLASSPGMDTTRVERAFLPRLRKRLRDGGVLLPTPDAPVVCHLVLSEERSAFWAVATLDGASLPAPSTVVVSMAVDRELEAALGAVMRPAQSRFVLERLGAVPAGVLDAALTDSDGDGVDELVLLGVDGVRTLRIGPAQLERIGGPYPLPGGRTWPRVLVGWLASLESGRVWGATSAGHAFVFDVRSQSMTRAPEGLAPLRGTSSRTGPLAASLRAGSPVLSLPLVAPAGGPVRVPGLPARVRDVAAGPGGSFICVTEAGELLGLRSATPPVALASERVGDRVLMADLASDGDVELVTTGATLPGEGDHIVVRRLASDLSSSSVAFRSPLSGGSVVAMASGRVEVGGRVEIVLIEEMGSEALAWRLRFSK